jgi:peroxiredoxin
MSLTSLGSNPPAFRQHCHAVWVPTLLAALLSSAALAATEPEPAPPPEIGLRIGQQAPPFTLNDQNGNQVSLDALLKKGPVALVFFRSADWCLACELQLVKLQRHVKEIEASGGTLVGISYDPPKTIKCFADKKTITIPILSDTDSKIIDAYGVRDRNAALAKNGVASHVTFILDQKGIVRDKIQRVIYDEKPGVDALVKGLKEAQDLKGGTMQ